MVIDNKQLARAKVQQVVEGYSAYAETKELAALIRKELDRLLIEVYEDCTEFGSWFIPVKLKTEA